MSIGSLFLVLALASHKRYKIGTFGFNTSFGQALPKPALGFFKQSEFLINNQPEGSASLLVLVRENLLLPLPRSLSAL